MRCLALFYLHASNLVKRLGKLLKRYLYYLISHGSHFFCISIMMMMVDKLNFYNRCCLKKKNRDRGWQSCKLTDNNVYLHWPW